MWAHIVFSPLDHMFMKDKVTMDQTIIILKSNENMRNGNTFYLNSNTTSPFLPYIHHLRLIVALFLSRNRATRAVNRSNHSLLRAPTVRFVRARCFVAANSCMIVIECSSIIISWPWEPIPFFYGQSRCWIGVFIFLLIHTNVRSLPLWH